MTWQEVAGGERVLALWVEIREDTSWVAAYRLVPQDGRPVIASVQLVPYHPDAEPGEWRGPVPHGGIPSQLRAAIRTEATLEALQEAVAWHLTGEWLPAEQRTSNREFVEDTQRRFGFEPTRLDERPRRPHLTSDSELAKTAAAYIAECHENPRSPRNSLAMKAGLSPGGLSKKLTAARERGILTSGRRGRSGGSLTAYGRVVLADSSAEASRDPAAT